MKSKVDTRESKIYRVSMSCYSLKKFVTQKGVLKMLVISGLVIIVFKNEYNLP